MFKRCIQKFMESRDYAIASSLVVAVIVGSFLSLFLIAKIVTEVRAWNKGSQEYAVNTISVTGEAEVVAVLDVATFTFAVDVTSESVESAQEEAAKSMNLALAYLTDNGVAEKDVKTTNYYVSPKYEYPNCRGIDCPSQEPKLVGYQVNQSVQVKVRDTSKAGEVLSGIGAQGVTNISGLNFTIDDETALQDEARSQAVKDARAQAEQLAKDLGVKLKKVVNFSEESHGGPYPMYDSFGMGGAETAMVKAISPELPTGENTITSRVFITYEIR